MSVDESIEKTKALLSEKGIEAISYRKHEMVNTSEAHAKLLGDVDGVIVKNLLFKDKKKALFLVCVPWDAQVNVKDLGKTVGKGGLRFADGDTLQAVLGCVQGNVSPLAVVNDKENQVNVIFSQDIEKSELCHVHPFTNEATVTLKTTDLVSFLQNHAHEVQFKEISSGTASAPESKNIPVKKVNPTKEKPSDDNDHDDVKEGSREALLGIEASKVHDFSRWYNQVVKRSEMVDYYDVSGCYILRPWAYFVWEQIQQFFDAKIKKLGVKNTYFPLFVSQAALIREKDHIEGFAPEVAWVTRAGSSDLQEPIAIRPTSETIMYNSFSKWIRSHRDLPLQINQWSNVVRWEFKHPTPFIRSREFLWQEGHSAFATLEEASKEVDDILDLYAKVYEELLAVPVTKGKKSEKEKFAGALYTTTIEVFVPAAGRGVQAATSHCLGQNFAKMFNITFEDKKGTPGLVWQNSWGLSTRSIGVMVMVHGDDKGLVMPPRVASIQVIAIPVYFKNTHDKDDAINDKIDEFVTALQNAGIRADSDMRTIYNPGWKYNHWELKGVPIRLEIGPKDIDTGKVVLVRRDTGEKISVEWKDVVGTCASLLDDIHTSMYNKAKQAAAPLVFQVETWPEFLDALQKGGRALVPWCNEVKCEEIVKDRSSEESLPTASGVSGSAKSLCIPYEQPQEKALKCFCCGNTAINWTLFGRSY